ncbi:MAG: hypothetical protein LBR60_07905 [Fibrobacter sp.]|jgi:hypothetical protein|nr:hypothetical protein [Fibrobacter sp.]
MKYFYLFFVLLFFACKDSSKTPIGLCDPPELSQDTLSFNAQGGTDSVSISSSFWWLTDYDFSEENCEMINTNDPNYCASNYCESGEIMKTKCSWFELQKIDAYTITVSVNPNETNQERHFRVFMQAGNCGAGFTITQATGNFAYRR